MSKPNIVVLDGIAFNPGDLDWAPISDQAETFRVYPSTKPDEILDKASKANIILTNKVQLSREVLTELKHLRAICVMSTGYNVIDVEACDELGIALMNVPDYSSPFVAQHTFSLLIEMLNEVGKTSHKVRDGQWQEMNRWCYYESTLYELADKTMGIVGMGNIGRRVAKIADGFGMKVIYYSRNPKKDLLYECLPIDDVFAQADVVSLHIQLTEETKHLVNAQRLSIMRPNAYLLNTGRGDLIDEEALAHTLRSNKIAGAGLDVLTNEPPENENPLIPLDNCVITPHQAWVGFEARQRLMLALQENIRLFTLGTPQNVVNTPIK